MTGVDITAQPIGEGGAGAAARAAGDRFRPDLEGLRAVAVLLVLAYHMGLPVFGGGYIGVDVFFVLSGFLITGLIVRELRSIGSVSLTMFYARRARRLLPAAILVIVVTLVAARLFMPPLVVRDVALDGAAAAVYASNMRFALQATDYLAAEAAPSPLLHYWSLGVEEQFYLVWPALLFVATRFSRRSLVPVATVVAVVGVLSFIASLLLTGINAPWAFYSLPTRAWELALGAVVALMAARDLSLPRRASTAAVGIGVALIVAGGVLFDTATAFPGTAALLPTVGAALVIAGGLREPLGAVSRALAVAPMRWIGRISYSLYLWHWPILVIPAAALQDELPLWARLGLGVPSVALAAVTQRWIEEPFRRGRLIGVRPSRNLALAGALSLAVALGGAWVGLRGAPATAASPAPVDPGIEEVIGTPPPTPSASPDPAPSDSAAPTSSPSVAPTPSPTDTPRPATGPQPVPANLQPPLTAAKEDIPRVYDDGCHVDQLVTSSPPCVYGDAGSDTTVVLFGDSHAAQWFPALERAATDNGWRLLSYTKALCAAVEGPVWNGRLAREYTECETWRDDVIGRIVSEEADLVVVANSKFATLSIDGEAEPDPQTEAWDAALGAMLERLAVSAGAVALIGDTPQHGVDPPVCLSANLDDALACATPMVEAVPSARLADDARVARAAGVRFVDPTAWTCPSDPCPVVIGSLLAFHDGGHLTRTFSEALAPYLVAALPRLGG